MRSHVPGGVIGLILMGIIMMALYECYSSSKIERENQARVEKFLEDYRDRRPTDILMQISER